MWRMDSLSVGISILWGQRAKLPGLQTVSGERLRIVFQADHDRWKWRSRSAGNRDHDALELMITMLWKP
jgi:hypothetical protein